MRRLFILLIVCLLQCACCGAERPQAKSVAEQQPERITVGAERTELYLPALQERRVALVANQSSLVGPMHLLDTLLALGVDVRRVFCPEHGFRGDAEAGAHIADGRDAATGVQLVSLYGSGKKPKPEHLADVDIVLFDLQDVGCRFYTYISTLHYVMEACAEYHQKLFVLDRPNPNSFYVDGPVLEGSQRSFVGMHPVPIVYGMTIGEYALMINGERWLKDSLLCDVEVIPLAHWTHDSLYRLPVAPSPNLRTGQSIALYPSLCLFEGTNISVGRGTDKPFELIGSPQFTAASGSAAWPLVQFTPHPIKGVSDNPLFSGQQCKGYDLSQVTPRRQIDLRYLLAMYAQTPHESFFLKNRFFDRLAGTPTLRRQIEAGLSEAEIRASWQPALRQFMQVRARYLLYPDFTPQETPR
ncbi:MAG: DUF1343 domain-containing protein [Bacteroidales bacterium]|nr:DUF1343 domain-containing protein [Bacteroidales bacterium]